MGTRVTKKVSVTVAGGPWPDDDRQLARLVRDGVVGPASDAAARAVVATSPPKARKGASAVRALLEERREGR